MLSLHMWTYSVNCKNTEYDTTMKTNEKHGPLGLDRSVAAVTERKVHKSEIVKICEIF